MRAVFDALDLRRVIRNGWVVHVELAYRREHAVERRKVGRLAVLQGALHFFEFAAKLVEQMRVSSLFRRRRVRRSETEEFDGVPVAFKKTCDAADGVPDGQ